MTTTAPENLGTAYRGTTVAGVVSTITLDANYAYVLVSNWDAADEMFVGVDGVVPADATAGVFPAGVVPIPKAICERSINSTGGSATVVKILTPTNATKFVVIGVKG